MANDHGYYLLQCALADPRIDDADIRVIATSMCEIYGPTGAPTAAQAQKARNFLDIMARTAPQRRRNAVRGPEPSREEAMNWTPPGKKATADEIIRAAAIARGEISELPTEPLARSIILANMKARNETPPGGKL